MIVSQLTPAEACRDVSAAIERMACVAPDAAQRAARALDTFLASWASSPDGPHRGRLTGNGFPVEIVCSTRDPAVRYTCEVAGPGVAPPLRIEVARRLIPAIEIDRPGPIAHLQDEAGALEWGAWIGGRHTATADSYKVYAEAPPMLSRRALAGLRDALGRRNAFLDNHVHTLRFVGFGAAPAQTELYFRGPSLRPEELGRLMAAAGVGDRVNDLLSLLEEAAPGPVHERLPGTQHGFSLAIGGAAVIAFSFFTFARSVFGDDATIRKGLLSLADRRGWDFDLYAAVSAPIARRCAPLPHHGMLSWVVPVGGPLGVAVGLQPPPAGAKDSDVPGERHD